MRDACLLLALTQALHAAGYMEDSAIECTRVLEYMEMEWSSRKPGDIAVNGRCIIINVATHEMQL